MLTPPGAALAILFAAAGPLQKGEIMKIIGMSAKELDSVLAALQESVEVAGLALIENGEELELRTSPEAAAFVEKLWEGERNRDLGKAGLETLAVIAYRGSAARSEVDWVRGVNSSASIRTLLLRGLIEGNEDPADERRVLYTLTTDALAHLSLSKRAELPRYSELSRDAAHALVAAEAGETVNT